MADSTTNLDTIQTAQASKEVTSNDLSDAFSPASFLGRRASTTTGLTWGYYGGRIYIDGVATAISNGTVALTLSATNYVEVDITGAVSKNTTGFSADKSPLYKIVTGASTITSYEDHRNPVTLRRLFYGRTTIAMADANKTLTQPQAACDSIECTGALTALRDLIVPTVKRPYTIYTNTTGGFGVRVKTSAGTGITVADGTRVTLECDGTNIVLVSSGLVNPMTSTGDIVVGGASGVPARLAAGSNGQVLALVAGTPAWQPPGGFVGGTLTSALNEATPVTIVSAATVAIGAAAANSITISGTTTITAFDTIAAGAIRRITFSGILLLTYNAASLILPTAASITTAAGDVAEFISLGAGNWSCTFYQRASGAALTGAGFTGGTLSADLIGSDYAWSRGMLKDMGNVFVDKGNSSTTTQTLDYTAGSHQKITATGNHTIATSNWPPTGNLGEMLLELVNGGAFTITWPTINWIKSDGSTTTTFSSNGVTLQTSGTDWVLLWSRDAGTTIYGKIVR